MTNLRKVCVGEVQHFIAAGHVLLIMELAQAPFTQAANGTRRPRGTRSAIPRLNRASLKLGAALVDAGAQLLVCSPFSDAVDYYTAMGYADVKSRGVIHFHGPSHPIVEEKRALLRETLGGRT